MSLSNELGEIAGALAAVEAAEKFDPNAGFLTKATAAVEGFKGILKCRGDKMPRSDSVQQVGNLDSQV